MSTPRTFKPMNIEAFKKAVETVAQEDNVPSLTFPTGKGAVVELPPVEGAPAAASSAPVPPQGTVQPAGGRRPRAPRKVNPAPMVRVAVDLPDYLTEAIRKRAAEENVTKRFIYLKAFRAAGFNIQDVDMMEDGRREP